MRGVGSRIVLLAATAAGFLSLGASQTPIRFAAEPKAVRDGGISAQPSMRPWRYRGANPDGWWCVREGCDGVQDGTAFVNAELRLAARLRVRVVRFELPWALLEPRRRAYDWARTDYIVRRAKRLGVTLLPVIVYTPGWAGESETTPPAAADLSAFARAAARRYRRTIRYWELWNEPDLARYWRGSPADYVRTVLRPGYRAIKAANPRARVVLGGPATVNVEWLEAVYAAGGGRYFDIAAYHDYSADRQILAHARFLRGFLRAHGQGRKSIWLGEYGLQEPGPDDPRQQAVMRFVLAEKAPIAMAIWYTLRDDRAMTCCPPQTVKTETYGLMSAGYAPKRGYETMRALLASRPRRR